MFTTDLIQVTPILFLILVGAVLMLLDAFKVRKFLPGFAAFGLLGAIILAALNHGDGYTQVAVFNETIMTNGFASMMIGFLCISGLFTLFFLSDFLKRQKIDIPDVYALLIFSIVGMILLANSNDLIISFIGLETMSICLYIMAALFKKDVRSNEAGLKYFLLGAFATGFLIYGIALIYGGSGSTNFSRMSIPDLAESGFMLPGVAMMIIGFLFKVSAFPFHQWTPDVYTGSPTPLAGFMATGSKMAAFIAFGIFLHKTLVPGLGDFEKYYNVIAVAALLTMIYGNIVAAQQKNLKRMLAYSSIAHSGYVLLALAGGENGLMPAVYYMFIYTLMNIGAFGILGMVEARHEDVDLEKWKGFGRKYPYLGAILAIFMLSLAGIPPLAGFLAKYFVFIAIIKSKLIVFAIIGILTSVVGAYYYIRVIMIMFFNKEETSSLEVSGSRYPMIGVGILAVLIIFFGLYPDMIDHIDLLYEKAGFYGPLLQP